MSTNTRPDIAVATSILARHVSSPTVVHWTGVKRIFRYLDHTKDKKLKLGNVAEQNVHLIGYADADWSNDTDDLKSNTGYLLKYLGAPITWSCRKQTLVTLSSTEAEYVAVSDAVKKPLWIRRLLHNFNQDTDEPVVIYEDNQSCIKLLQDVKAHHRTKHISTKYHFVLDLYKKNNITVKYCPNTQY